VSVAEDCLSPERTFHGCSLMHGLKSGSCRFWQRTDLPPGSNMLRLAYADSGSACKLAGVQIIPLPTLANQILARTFFRSVVLQLACPAAGKFSRASSAGGRLNLQLNVEQSDRVGRRGLSEPREDFSRLLTYAFPRLFPRLDSAVVSVARFRGCFRGSIPRLFPRRKITVASEARSQ
jgi:hypothetical protein